MRITFLPTGLARWLHDASPMMKQTLTRITCLLAAGTTISLATACDTDTEQGPKVSEEEAKIREKAGLTPADHLEKRPETAEALKEELDIEPDQDKPQTEKEIREEMDLHPDKVEE